MFERFIKNKMCVDIMMWLLNHSTGDYDAAIIAHDIKAQDLSLFTTGLYILDELDIINTNNDIDDGENLRVIFNEDSLIVQCFRTLQETFDSEAYRNSNACGALSDFVTVYDNQITEESIIEMIKEMPDEFVDLFIDMFKNYESIEFDSNPLIAERQKAVQAEARRLDELGELDNFLEFVKVNRK